jgi:AcrR family transcriptional regulator
VPVADRGQVIAAALRAIERHGADMTMDDVAAEAAVSKPIVYRTVGDRAAVSVALSEWLIDRIDLATNAARDGAPTPRHRFRAAIRAYLVTVEEHADVFEFVNGGQPMPVYQRLAERSARTLVEVFREVRRQAGFDVDGAETWAYAVVGALQMISTMSQGGPAIDPDAVSEDLAGLMWDGLGAAVER